MGALEVVETLSDCKPAVQFLEPRHHHSVELPVKLLVVDSVGPLSLPVQVRTPRPDVPMLNAFIEHVPVKLRPELAAVIGLNTVHLDCYSVLLFALPSLEDHARCSRELLA